MVRREEEEIGEETETETDVMETTVMETNIIKEIRVVVEIETEITEIMVQKEREERGPRAAVDPVDLGTTLQAADVSVQMRKARAHQSVMLITWYLGTWKLIGIAVVPEVSVISSCHLVPSS